MLRKYLLFFLFILLILNFFSCLNGKESKYLVGTKLAYDADSYSIKIKSLSIPCIGNVIKQYYTFSIFTKGNKSYFIGYNPALSTIDIFNLYNKVLIKRLNLNEKHLSVSSLDKKDLDKSKSITDIAVINLDSIILNYANKKLIILDTASNLKKLIALEDIEKKNHIKLISYSHDFKMFIYKDNLVLKHLYPNHNWNEALPIFTALNLNNLRSFDLPIAYSEYLYNIHGKAGFLSTVLTSEYQKPGLITYNYLYESNIYQYDPKTLTVTCYGAKVSDGKNLADSISYNTENDLEKWKTHYVENPQFFNIIYDKYRNLYYRFSLKDIPRSNGDYYNTVLDKPLKLMVFNDKFEVIKELELPMYKYATNTWFVTKDGLFISPTHLKNKNSNSSSFVFDIFQISKN